MSSRIWAAGPYWSASIFRLKFLITTCVLALTISDAAASSVTFECVSCYFPPKINTAGGNNGTGLTLTGTFTVDQSPGPNYGDITAVDFALQGPPGDPLVGSQDPLGIATFTTLGGPFKNFNGTYSTPAPAQIEFTNTNLSEHGPVELDIELDFDITNVSYLGSYAGGAIVVGPSSNLDGACGAYCTGLSGNFVEVTATPLPAGLPLFATGLGALGLFGWRRKRKTQAIAA